MKVTITGKQCEGKSTLLIWLLMNLPAERFEARKINDHELSVRLIRTALPAHYEKLIEEESYSMRC